MPPLGNDDASGSPWTSEPPEKLEIASPAPSVSRKLSCFSALRPVRG